jgi:tRNA (cmo5U34)-methyltransferase
MSGTGPVTAAIWKQAAIVERFLNFHAAIPLAREQIGVMQSLLASRPEPVGSFLDLGCGDGILGAALLEKYPKSLGVLADFSTPMLEQARVQLQGHAARLQFVNLDYGDPGWVQALTAPGTVPPAWLAPYDAVVSRYSIHHQPDDRKRAVYTGIFDLLAPGGWFVNIEHILPSADLATDLFDQAVIDGRYALDVENGGQRTREQIADIFMKRPDRQANLLTPVETQCDWLREIGYEQVDCYFRIYELAVFGGRRPAEAPQTRMAGWQL